MDNTSNNVFLVTDNTIQSMKFKGIKFSEGQILCINTSNNRLKLRLEGLGDGVLVGELL